MHYSHWMHHCIHALNNVIYDLGPLVPIGVHCMTASVAVKFHFIEHLGHPRILLFVKYKFVMYKSNRDVEFLYYSGN